MGKFHQFLTMLSARHTSLFSFQGDINRFSPNLVCALILGRSDLGLLMAKFRQFLLLLILKKSLFKISIKINVFVALC